MWNRLLEGQVRSQRHRTRSAPPLLLALVLSTALCARAQTPASEQFDDLSHRAPGKRVERLGDLEEALGTARSWLPAEPTERLWLPYLGGALDAGAATLVAQEAIEALKPLRGIPTAFDYWLGPTSDGILREQGIKLVDGRMPGFAACVGALPDDETAVGI